MGYSYRKPCDRGTQAVGREAGERRLMTYPSAALLGKLRLKQDIRLLMFCTVSYHAHKGNDPLKQLVKSARVSLTENMRLVSYPEGLTMANWRSNYKKIDKLNSDLLKAIQDKSGVYAILTFDHRRNIILRYIGKTFSKYSRQRIRAHLIWRNKITKSGKFTGSKFDEVQETVSKNKSVYIAFVEIKPATLRHYVEGILLEYFSPEWNIQEVPKISGRHRTRCNWSNYWTGNEPLSSS